MSMANQIQISFLGGASSIGASCTLVKVAGVSFVVDCGVRYSGSSPLPDLSMLAEERVDAVLMTHAHMDHSGGLPVLAEACPGAPVFATPPTMDLIGILLRDALRLMNAPDRESEVPLYTQHQVDALLGRMAPVKHHQPIQVGEVEIRWLPASHILGASMILLKSPAGTILFTGDYSITAQQTVPALARPDFQADLVISEATYGERLHEDRDVAEERLLGQVAEVIGRGGRVLIPAFAVGRAQEVLLILKRALAMGHSRTRRFSWTAWCGPCVTSIAAMSRSYRAVCCTRSAARRTRSIPMRSGRCRGGRTARVLDTSPSIIVASSGMLAGGPSQGYCLELLKNPNDAVLLTGYQDEESPGRALLELARTDGPKEMRLGPATVPVACRFGTYGLSAHADRMQMVSWIEATAPRTVVLVHGDETAKQALSRSSALRGRGLCARRPDDPAPINRAAARIGDLPPSSPPPISSISRGRGTCWDRPAERRWRRCGGRGVVWASSRSDDRRTLRARAGNSWVGAARRPATGSIVGPGGQGNRPVSRRSGAGGIAEAG